MSCWWKACRPKPGGCSLSGGRLYRCLELVFLKKSVLGTYSSDIRTPFLISSHAAAATTSSVRRFFKMPESSQLRRSLLHGLSIGVPMFLSHHPSPTVLRRSMVYLPLSVVGRRKMAVMPCPKVLESRLSVVRPRTTKRITLLRIVQKPILGNCAVVIQYIFEHTLRLNWLPHQAHLIRRNMVLQKTFHLRSANTSSHNSFHSISGVNMAKYRSHLEVVLSLDHYSPLRPGGLQPDICVRGGSPI